MRRLVARLRALGAGERGYSLVEVLVALALVGLTFGAILGGLSALTISTERQGRMVAVEAALSQAKHAVGTVSYDAGASAPTTYRAALPAVPGVTFADPVVTTVTGTVQAVTIQASSGAVTRTVVLYKSDR